MGRDGLTGYQNLDQQEKMKVPSHEPVSGGKDAKTIQIEALLKEKEALLREINHRVRNNLQIILSLLSLQSRHLKDKEALEFIQKCESRIRAMAGVPERLYIRGSATEIDVAEYIDDLLVSLCVSNKVERSRIGLDVELPGCTLGTDTMISMGLIVNELVSNSLMHAFPSGSAGKVMVTVAAQGENGVKLTIKDEGVGLPKGFDLTSDVKLGLQLVRALAEQHDGTIDISGDMGTRFVITLREREYADRLANTGLNSP